LSTVVEQAELDDEDQSKILEWILEEKVRRKGEILKALETDEIKDATEMKQRPFDRFKDAAERIFKEEPAM